MITPIKIIKTTKRNIRIATFKHLHLIPKHCGTPMSERKTFSGKGLVVGLVITMLIGYFTLPHPVIKEEKEKTWHVVWEGTLAEATEADPGAGASGFLEIFFVNHSNTGTTTYLTNVSSDMEDWCNASLDVDGTGTGYYAYAIADNFNLQLKHSTALDIVIRVRFNKTHAWNGTDFVDADTRVNITASGGGITILGTTSGTRAVTRNDTSDDYIWINNYWNNSNAGYQLQKGGTCSITSISIQAKY